MSRWKHGLGPRFAVAHRTPTKSGEGKCESFIHSFCSFIHSFLNKLVNRSIVNWSIVCYSISHSVICM